MRNRRPKTFLTESQRAMALADFKNGDDIVDIAKRLGVVRDTIRRIVDPAWARRRQDQINATRRFNGYSGRGRPSRHVTDEDAEYLAGKPPADTRDLTAKLCGDPLPGRSALDRKRGAAT